MPTTPNSKLPYPASTDPADVPADMQKLALALDEIAYAEITANVTVAAPGPTDIVSTAAITYAATPIIIEFGAAEVETGAPQGAFVLVNLWDGATDLGQIGFLINPGSAGAVLGAAMAARRRLTPTAASHTYRVRASAAGAAGKVSAGTGVAGQYAPAYIRITHA